MSGGDDNDVQRIKVSFKSGFNKAELVPFEAYVEYGGTRNVIRCTIARNGSIVLYGSWVLAACIDKDRNAACQALSEIIQGDRRLKHAGFELKNLDKEVVYIRINATTYIFI
jgi:hypothetical protein